MRRRRTPVFFGIHAQPPTWLNFKLAVLPFVLLGGLYLWQSAVKTAENPDYKLMPLPTKMVEAMESYVMGVENRRTGETTHHLWTDTGASLRRLGIGMGISIAIGLLLGINMGVFPGMRALLFPFVTAWSKIQPLAMLPIILIITSTGEMNKIVLIVLGTAAPMVLDTMFAVDKIPREQFTKVLTLGASQLDVVYRVVMPQVFPRVIDLIRLQLGPAWTFLLAAEFISSDVGLGYRIFLVRRYLSMDVIIPYVIWVTLLAFIMDYLLQVYSKRAFPWYQHS